MNIVQIIPVPVTGDGPQKTQGTKVVLADGTALEGVTRIELVADTNDVWRARIDVMVLPPKLDGVLAVIEANAYQGVGEIDVTNIGDDSVRFAKVDPE